MKKAFKNGFSLMEVIVAIFITVVGIIGIYSVIGDLSAMAQDANQRLVAAYIGEEGLEIVRNIRDNNIRAREKEPCASNKNQCPNWDRFLGADSVAGPGIKSKPLFLEYDYLDMAKWDSIFSADNIKPFPSDCSNYPNFSDTDLNKCYGAIFDSNPSSGGVRKLFVDDNGLYSYKNSSDKKESPFKRVIAISSCDNTNPEINALYGDAAGTETISDADCMLVDVIVVWKDRKIRGIRISQEMYNYFRE